MPRTKPTSQLGVYGKYDIKPENAVRLHLESKIQNKYYIKTPYWDVAREGLELNAIQNEREHVEMTKLQYDMREQAKIQTKVNEKRISEMYKIQSKLRDKFIFVNDFMKDCEEKEVRADKKIEEEINLQNSITKEIDEIKFDLQELSIFEETLKETVEKFKPYEDIVEQVVAESDLFLSVKDLMDRCDALMIAQVEISEIEQEKIKSIENMRQEMVKATNEAALTVMGLNNELAELERCYNTATSESLKWETILAATKDLIADNELTTFRLVDSIRQLYKLFAARNNEENLIGGNNYEEMLDYVKEQMEIIKEVIRVSNVRIAKEQKSLLAEKGSVGRRN